MRITITSVLVDDQSKALRFYTEMLGFVKKADIPLGESRWLTVVSPESPEGPELLLEPDSNPAVRAATQGFKKALYEAGIPLTMFAVDDVRQEYERLSRLGVAFRVPPTNAGPVAIAILDDTCGNLIQIVGPS